MKKSPQFGISLSLV